MDYKYYTQEGSDYVLKPPTAMLNFSMILFGIIGIFGLYYGFASNSKGGLAWGIICLLVAAFVFYRTKSRSITFQSSLKKVLVKQGNKVTEYLFDDFLNFHTTIIRNGLITTQRQVSMYFNNNGKNKNILLGIVIGKKKADRLITETGEIMGKNSTSIRH